ncbi:hypothetical protein PSTT_13777 [Puccinia striiformis]|uniref:KARI N-terminal Rossmann domain-containing protein n=1 Tax=Puccinia striiformis TaxID=27350 RepID=A0A2S4UQ17_9BASI|nr:hypothetical protein PSTT_13777 [Puccinia striiformis]
MSFRQILPTVPRAVRSSARPNGKQAYSILTGRVSTPLVNSSSSPASPRAAGLNQTQTRGVKTLDFAGHKEVVYERADWPAAKLQEYFKNDTLAIIGYGSQGHGQGLNARDNGLNVIIGVREGGASWKAAEADGWVPGKTLLPINQALEKGTIIMNLLSDAAQSQTWESIKPYLTKGKTLYFSHGFSVVYKNDTGVVPPKDIDVILCAPKGSGRTVRTLFQEGRGINGSVAVWQDVTGQAKEKAWLLVGYVPRPVQGITRKRTQSLRSLQRDCRGGHSISVPPDWSPWHGLHVCRLLHNCASWCVGLGPQVRSRQQAIFEALYKSVKNGDETDDRSNSMAEKLTLKTWQGTGRDRLPRDLESGKTVRGLRPDSKKA